jgi:hypothetical protein
VRNAGAATNVSVEPPGAADHVRECRIVIAACALFFGLTIAAMFLCPGDRIGDVDSNGYAFLRN